MYTGSIQFCCKFDTFLCVTSLLPHTALPCRVSTLPLRRLRIENIYILSRYVAQAYLYGDSLKLCVVAIIVPDEDAVNAWAKENGISGSFVELCTNDVRMMSSFKH